MRQLSVWLFQFGDEYRLFARRDKIRSEESPFVIKCRGGGSCIALKVSDFGELCGPSKPIVPFNIESSGV